MYKRQELGELEYRTLDFDHKILDTENFQGCAAMNHTDDLVSHTRTIEHKHFEGSSSDKTVVSYETPAKWSRNKIPYYPINDEKNNSVYESYRKESQKIHNTVFGGRLADYKYYDMHQVIGSALSKSSRILK